MKFKQCRRSWWTVRLKSTSVNNSSVCHTQALTLPQSSLPWTKPKWHLISLISQNYTPKTVNYLTRKGTWIRAAAVAAAAKSLQSCPTLCDSIDGSLPGSLVPGILQARTPERAAISFSNAWKWKVKVKSLSRVRLLVTPWTAAYQAPPSMGFSRQEHCSGVPLPRVLQI